MSRRDAKLLAKSWVDSPELMAQDLRALLNWIEANALSASADPSQAVHGTMVAASARAFEAMQQLQSLVTALGEYRRQVPQTKLNIDLLQPLVEAFSEAAAGRTDVPIEKFSSIQQDLVAIERWALSQKKQSSEPPNRSELLKATIELVDDELIVKTDMNGSLKLRGTTNIPMFLAFWRAPKHRLGIDAFLEIDTRSSHTSLERHRTRLCAKLQDVLLEIVTDENGLRMQRCR